MTTLHNLKTTNTFQEDQSKKQQPLLKALTQWFKKNPEDVRFSVQSKVDKFGSRDFVFTKVNRAFCTMMGESAIRLIGRGLREMLHISADHSFYQKYIKVYATDEPFIEMFPSPFGGGRWIFHQIIKINEEISVLINFVHIDKQRHPWLTEDEKNSEEMIQYVLPSGAIEFMNPVAAQYFTWDDFKDQKISMGDILHPVSKLAYQMALQRVTNHRVETSLPLVFVTKDHYFLKARGTLVPQYKNQQIKLIQQYFQIENIASDLSEVSTYASEESYNVF
ncbi:MAG TPA: hypothetical protein DCS93_25835 [Microscillaceae bacterium]|nr:hypothetical protein [Microscillaceae bacterium]